MKTINTIPTNVRSLVPKNVVGIEGKLSHYRQVTNGYGQPVNVPVIDVRDGLAERLLAGFILKASHKSMYIPYNEYHISKKPKE